LSVERALAALRSLGHTITPVRLPYTPAVALAWIACWLAGTAQDVARLGLSMEGLEPRTRWMVRRGRWLMGRYTSDLVRVRRVMRAWRQRAAESLDSYDVLLTPAISRPAPRFGWGAGAGFVRSFGSGSGVTPYTQAWNLAGFPAMSLPLDLGDGGLPGAVQLVTVPGREAPLISLAAQLARRGV
jgi:amidase